MNVGSEIGVLFLHALPLDGRMWAAQQSLFPGRSYAPNLYQYGDDVEVWAERALALVAQDKLVVVGNSIGGSCALEVARLAPERIVGLVLIGSKIHRTLDTAALEEAIRLVRTQGVEAAWERFWAPLFDPVINQPAMWAARDIALGQSAEHLINGLRAFYTRPSREDALAELDVPVCVITSDQDPLPGVGYSKTLAELARSGTFHMIANCGHYVPMTQPEALNAILCAFDAEAARTLASDIV